MPGLFRILASAALDLLNRTIVADDFMPSRQFSAGSSRTRDG
jgi:hypothetical protein